MWGIVWSTIDGSWYPEGKTTKGNVSTHQNASQITGKLIISTEKYTGTIYNAQIILYTFQTINCCSPRLVLSCQRATLFLLSTTLLFMSCLPTCHSHWQLQSGTLPVPVLSVIRSSFLVNSLVFTTDSLSPSLFLLSFCPSSFHHVLFIRFRLTLTVPIPFSSCSILLSLYQSIYFPIHHSLSLGC